MEIQRRRDLARLCNSPVAHHSTPVLEKLKFVFFSSPCKYFVIIHRGTPCIIINRMQNQSFQASPTKKPVFGGAPQLSRCLSLGSLIENVNQENTDTANDFMKHNSFFSFFPRVRRRLVVRCGCLGAVPTEPVHEFVKVNLTILVFIQRNQTLCQLSIANDCKEKKTREQVSDCSARCGEDVIFKCTSFQLRNQGPHITFYTLSSTKKRFKLLLDVRSINQQARTNRRDQFSRFRLCRICGNILLLDVKWGYSPNRGSWSGPMTSTKRKIPRSSPFWSSPRWCKITIPRIRYFMSPFSLGMISKSSRDVGEQRFRKTSSVPWVIFIQSANSSLNISVVKLVSKLVDQLAKLFHGDTARVI